MALLAFTACMSKEAAALKKEYPQYFGLDTSKGLDIIVWQMAADSYSFGLLPHSEEERDWQDADLKNLKGVTAEQMKTILSTYKTESITLNVVPWQNPVSSYIPEDLQGHGGDGPMLAAAYKSKIKKMLSI